MASLMLVNPRKRRSTKSKSKSKITKRKRSPGRALASVKTTVRRYRRNPIAGRGIVSKIGDGAIGAGGALVADLLMAKLPIPEQFTSSPLMSSVTKGVLGIGAGMAVSKFARNKKLGEQLAAGAVTIAMYNAGRGMIGPSLGLSSVDDGLLGWDDGLLGYEDFNDGMGWNSPESVQDWDSSLEGYDEF